MRKELKKYHGQEITLEVISKMFAICAVRNFRVDGLIPYDDIDTLEDLCTCYDCNLEEINVVLGQDWFISYVERENSIDIIDWVSLDNVKNKFMQSLEMMKQIIEILLLAENRTIDAMMRHSTSYKFYELLKEQGYITELYNCAGMDESIPTDIQDELDKKLSKKPRIEYYLEDETRNKDYDEYFHHDITFLLTEKFFTRYSKTPIKK